MKIQIEKEEYRGKTIFYIDDMEGGIGKWRSFNKNKKCWTSTILVLTNKNYNFSSLGEAQQALKDWFDTQPDEVFAEYVAQRLSHGSDDNRV